MKISVDELRRLVDEGLSTGEIALRLGVSRSAVRYHLKKLGSVDSVRRPSVNLEALKKLIDEGLPVDEIAKRLGVSSDVVRYYKWKLGVPARVIRKQIDVDKLKKLWFDASRRVFDIAAELGVSYPTLLRIAHNLGLPDRRILKKRMLSYVDSSLSKIVDHVSSEGIVFRAYTPFPSADMDRAASLGLIKKARFLIPFSPVLKRFLGSGRVFPSYVIYWVNDDDMVRRVVDMLIELIKECCMDVDEFELRYVKKSINNVVSNSTLPQELKAKILEGFNTELSKIKCKIK